TTPPPNSNAGSYTFLAPLPFFGGPSINIAEGGLAGYLDGLYKAGIAVATGLALIMIVAGGLEYASAGSVGGKDGGKSKIKNALIGLLLALTSFIILQQINPGLIRNDLAVDATKAVGGITGQTVDLVAGGGTINQIIPPGQPGSYVLANNENPSTGTVFSNYSSLKQLLNSLPSGPRSTDGSLIFTNYWNGDTNTNQQRGNNCNLLVSGSVALSPDLISRYNPKKGAAVYVNGLLVGYFDDTTGATTLGYVGGTLIRNTIDIYDPNRTLGSVLKKMPPNSWYLVFGTQRAQTPNPCPR
ncbi:MAG: hypothetical protein KBB54_00515, partial [Candidatus Pacebacteria bacterium]|nr:hypothetical protein [Candidatus Paceibacterota bacterium]